MSGATRTLVSSGGGLAGPMFRGAVYFRSLPPEGFNQRNRGMSMIPDPKTRPVMTAEEAFAELGIDRSTGYRAIRDGTFPLPVVRVGRLIRVPTVAVRRLLQLDSPAAGRDTGTEAQ